jgi:hypothetical protein
MKITKGKSGGMIGGVRSPMGSASKGLIKKGSLNPRVADNVCREDISVAGARVRSAQTGGKIIKPF